MQVNTEVYSSTSKILVANVVNVNYNIKIVLLHSATYQWNKVACLL